MENTMTIVDKSQPTEAKVTYTKRDKKKMEKAAKELLEEQRKIETMIKDKKERMNKLRYNLVLQRTGSNPLETIEDTLSYVQKVVEYIYADMDKVIESKDDVYKKDMADKCDLRYNVVTKIMTSSPHKTVDELIADSTKAVEYIHQT